jgi:hypothetical protein
MGVDGAMWIANALELNRSLVSLNIGSNDIKMQGAICLARAITVNNKLTSLNLSNY